MNVIGHGVMLAHQNISEKNIRDRFILVVDDEPFILKTTIVILKKIGIQNVITAQNAQVAMLQLKQHADQINLVLLDLNMPDVDGIELLRELNNTGYNKDIIIFSGEDPQTLSMAENLGRARQMSILGSIAKPIDEAHFIQLLASHQDNNSSSHCGEQKRCIIASHIEQGIANNEFEPWFQPKIDIANKTPIGVEVLARWPSPNLGSVFPNEFILAAEQAELINDLTFLLIKKVMKFDQQWRKNKINLNIAFNVSMDSLQHANFIENFLAVMADSDKAFEQIEIEVTESQLMQNVVQPLENLLRFKLKRVRLSIDDFGTGHSNLLQLRTLPFDELKLDRAFVHTDANDERAFALLESSIQIAKKLNMTIVAEGVEDIHDWNKVARLGCDHVQGYFIAKPMPGDEVLSWIADWPEYRKKLFDIT